MRGVTSSEVSRFLRLALGEPEVQADPGAPRVSSHSLKATCLSWAAKYGCSTSVRSLLGRHVSAVQETQAVYSRDLAVAPTGSSKPR